MGLQTKATRPLQGSHIFREGQMIIEFGDALTQSRTSEA